MTEACFSTANGPRFNSTWTQYFLSSCFGTRHEYLQVKPQPYLNVSRVTTSPFELAMVKAAPSGCSPFTRS
jgi:hypothetical protein